MATRKRPSQRRSVASEDEPRGFDSWAKALVSSIGKRSARSLLEDYETRSKDTKVTKYGRDIASQQAAALKKVL